MNAEYFLCSECLSSIKFVDNPSKVENSPQEIDFYSIVSEVYSVCFYESTGKMIIVDLKYKNNTDMAKTAAAMMHDVIKKYKLSSDLIAYVPSHKTRINERGYNQAELIAAEISKITGIPVTDSLKRIKNNKQQVLFDTRGRWYNVKDIFLCEEDMRGKTVIIVDDVITTGATIYYASKELKKAGAEKVTALSFARA